MKTSGCISQDGMDWRERVKISVDVKQQRTRPTQVTLLLYFPILWLWLQKIALWLQKIALLFGINCTEINHSQSRNIFMYIIIIENNGNPANHYEIYNNYIKHAYIVFIL
jgi:hypothetical protein